MQDRVRSRKVAALPRRRVRVVANAQREDDRHSMEYMLSRKLHAVYELAEGAMTEPFLAVAEYVYGVPSRLEHPVVSLTPDEGGGLVARLTSGGAYRFPDSFALRAGLEGLARSMALTGSENEHVLGALGTLRDRELERDLAYGRDLAPDVRAAVDRGDLTLSR